jgi:hypothetical protein
MEPELSLQSPEALLSLPLPRPQLLLLLLPQPPLLLLQLPLLQLEVA